MVRLSRELDVLMVHWCFWHTETTLVQVITLVQLYLNPDTLHCIQILESVIACLKLEVMWDVQELLDEPAPTKVSPYPTHLIVS